MTGEEYAFNEFSLTLARGISVLEQFDAPETNLTTTDLAERLQLSRAAVRRFLLTFVKLGYLAKSGTGFVLTTKLASLGRPGLPLEGRWMTATPHILELANRVNESVSLSVLDGLQIRYVARDQKRRMFSKRLLVGDKLPANCSAAGKVLLAALQPEHLDRLIGDGNSLIQMTPQSITDPNNLRAEIRQVRLQGWAQVEEEMEGGMIAVAVPVYDETNDVIAALALASNKARRSLDELRKDFLPLLFDTAEKIGTVLAEQSKAPSRTNTSLRVFESTPVGLA
jgi:IclR family transcriptional regulator, pca regulon regulatory protein